MPVRRWVCAEDLNTRVKGTTTEGRGGFPSNYIGLADGYVHRMFTKFADTYDDQGAGQPAVGHITRAEIVFTVRAHFINIGSGAKLVAHRLTKPFDTDNGDTWRAGAYDAPAAVTTLKWVNDPNGFIPSAPGSKFRIDVRDYVQLIAPHGVTVEVTSGAGKPGGGLTDHGLRWKSPDEGNNQHRVEVCADDGSINVDDRPYIEIEYEPKNPPPTALWSEPKGDTATGTHYTGTYAYQQNRIAAKVHIRVWDVGLDKVVREHTTDRQPQWVDGAWDMADPFPAQPPLPKKHKAGGPFITYEGEAQVWDTAGVASAWTPRSNGRFRVLSVSPTVGTFSSGTWNLPALDSHLTLREVKFRAPWTTDPSVGGVASYQVQLRGRTTSGSALWSDLIWDANFVPRAKEKQDKKADFEYSGPDLAIGDYSWRMRVIDALGEESEWAYDHTLSITQDADDNDDDVDVVAYGREAFATRVVLMSVDTSDGGRRAPGRVLGIIEDPTNLGVSAYASTPGQLYFTLQNRHPQVSVIEPLRTHYRLEQYRGAAWKTLSEGLMTDFDANPNDTIFYGLDYVGVLSLSVEAQSQPAKHAEAGWGAQGAKYKHVPISDIIRDQLERAIGLYGTTAEQHDRRDLSPVGFFTIPSGAAGVEVMDTKISIHSAYVQRLDFIRGLIDSYRGGASGRRPRITARRNANGTYQFVVKAHSGNDKNGIRLEYGGLIQGYQVVAMGDYATHVYGMGRLRNQLKPRFKDVVAPGGLKARGEIAKVNLWSDLADGDDFTRRVKQMANETFRVGKRVALGLRVKAMLPIDGWDITDSVIIDIHDGTVNTDNYGGTPPDPETGEEKHDTRWTIWGWEWRLFPDGHDEMTLVTKPKEDDGAPDVDLIDGEPIHVQPEWQVRHGPPTPTSTP